MVKKTALWSFCSLKLVSRLNHMYVKLFQFLTSLKFLKQLTAGENHGKLRRVDSNRKSRSFNKQPSTGDYYKTLGSDTPEARGSKGMAPNEEVRQISAARPSLHVFWLNKQKKWIDYKTNAYLLHWGVLLWYIIFKTYFLLICYNFNGSVI